MSCFLAKKKRAQDGEESTLGLLLSDEVLI